jgi:membrane fusion protein, heavy metal efflux system
MPSTMRFIDCERLRYSKYSATVKSKNVGLAASCPTPRSFEIGLSVTPWQPDGSGRTTAFFRIRNTVGPGDSCVAQAASVHCGDRKLLFPPRTGTLRRVKIRFVIALACAFLFGCPKSATETVPTPKAKSADVDLELSGPALEAAHLGIGNPKVSERRTSVRAIGALDFVPTRVARIGPSVGGRVAAINVTVGQKVRAGAALMTLDSVDAGRARADLLSSRSKLAQAELELEREKRLQAGGASSERAVAQAETEKNLALTDVRAAEARLGTLGKGTGVSGISLTSPIAGTVLEVRTRLGQSVGATDTLAIVGEIDQVWLRVDLYERDFAKVQSGDPVRVVTVAYPGRVFEGRVDLVGTVVDPDRRVVEARIVLANADGVLRPGMTATARILCAVAGGADPDAGGPRMLSVPKSAIQTIDGQPFLFVEKEKGKFELRPIERGADLESEVEVARGVSEADRIVIEGAFILKSEILKDQMGTND